MTSKALTGVLLDEHVELSLQDLCHACSTSTEWIIELVDEGVLEPIGQEPARWRFSGPNLLRARTAMRMQKDLHINLAGVALVLDLLEEIEAMRIRIRQFETDNNP